MNIRSRRITAMAIIAAAGAFMFFNMNMCLAGEEDEKLWSVCIYGGRWSQNRIGEIVLFDTRVRDTYVWAAALSRRVYRLSDSLALEAELNVARHTGWQRHFELNAAVNLRWNRFPWDNHVDTSLSYGLGPSYAFKRPPIEQRSDRGPAHFLVFMPVEITFGPPSGRLEPWEILVRVHHRSGAYGVVSDARGSNFVTTGLRRRF